MSVRVIFYYLNDVLNLNWCDFFSAIPFSLLSHSYGLIVSSPKLSEPGLFALEKNVEIMSYFWRICKEKGGFSLL